MSHESADQLSIEIDQELSNLSPIGDDRSIYRVHEHLRNVNQNAYEPQILAIGPYHRNKNHLKVMEEHKRRYLKRLLQRGGENDMTMYVTTMKNLETRARGCYACEFANLESDEFVKMMLLDSCFIVELIRKRRGFTFREANDPIFGLAWVGNSIYRDMLLVENQLPFFVIWEFFRMTLMPIEGIHSATNMVDLLFLAVLPNGIVPNCSRFVTEGSIQNIKHLVSLLHDNWRPPPKENFGDWDFIRSATELKEAGIKFKKVDRDSLFEINFQGNGVLEIPTFQITDRTETLLRNLIAYEQFFLNESLNYVTDYTKFMDSLINPPKDVELLCQSGIIQNWLGDDEVIAKMFNRLGDNVILSRENFYYSDLCNKVNKYRSKLWNRRMAILRHNYFNTPWALISFLAALSLLLLTAAQTLFSAFSLNK